MSEKVTSSETAKTPFERTIERIAGELKILHNKAVEEATGRLGNHGKIVEDVPDFVEQAKHLFDVEFCTMVRERVLQKYGEQQFNVGTYPQSGVPMPPPPRNL